MPITKPVVILDTREQAPWTFTDAVEVIRRGLPVADYSLDGLETSVGIERKSINDAVGSLTHSRDRFFRELEKLAKYDFRRLILEFCVSDLLEHHYQSMAHPNSMLGSLMSIDVDFSIPVVWACNREYAQGIAERMLTRIWRAEERKENEAARIEQCRAGFIGE